MAKEIYWSGKLDKCQVCHGPFDGAMFDAPLNTSGEKVGWGVLPWGNACEPCWRAYGPGRLGIGLGQKYEQQADGRFKCVGGNE